jgi:hypothetical protein
MAYFLVELYQPHRADAGVQNAAHQDRAKAAPPACQCDAVRHPQSISAPPHETCSALYQAPCADAARQAAAHCELSVERVTEATLSRE